MTPSTSQKTTPAWLAPVGIVVGILILLGLWCMSGYNTLVTLDEQGNQAWSNIEVQYQRRFDLIPNIEKTVEASANFEKSTLTDVVHARNAWAQAQTPDQKIAAANSLDSGLSRLLVTVEAYPQLQSTQAFRDLNTELEGTENRISYARTSYNAIATQYNATVRSFPKNIIANVAGFSAHKELFTAVAGSDQPVQVDFSNLK